jgi:GntR family transcriptional regulator/MocR family aminotransferase
MEKRSQGPIVPSFTFDRSSRAPVYRQVFSGLRRAIVEGRMRPGQRLPSTRSLARELGVSRMPVLTAFEQLLHEGYVVGRVGAGTYVSAAISERGHTAERRPGKDATRPSQGPEATPHPESLIAPFRVSLPALDRFPSRTWARLVSRHARRMSIAEMAYGDPAGHRSLRDAIAKYLRTARAVECDAEQILIVAGSQMALRLCAIALLKAGDDVSVENPGYPGARDALSATGATVRGVPVDHEGLLVRRLADSSRAPRLVYVTPSHQYPLGMSMSAARRLELLEFARQHESWVVEDDYDSEYRFASRPLGALQGMDRASRVIYVGTFSKVMFPSLRIGYVVVPPTLLTAFIAHRESLDIFPPTLYQLALTDFLNDGHFARHVRRMRSVYLGRRDALVAGIRNHLNGDLSVVNADAGMHLTTWLRPDIDDREVVRRAAACGISATALSTCYVGRPRRMGLVLGFGGAAETELTTAVGTLAAIIRQLASRRSRSSQRSHSAS